jgi:hypothetical protein
VSRPFVLTSYFVLFLFFYFLVIGADGSPPQKDSGNGNKVVVVSSPYTWSSPTVTQEDGNGGNTVAGDFNYVG